MEKTQTTTKNLFYYRVIDSMGRPTDIEYAAENIKDAYSQFRADRKNYSRHAYGKLQRVYNGGVRG